MLQGRQIVEFLGGRKLKVENYIGKKIGELAKCTGIFWQPARIFVLQDETDDTGKYLMFAYSIQQVIDAYPSTQEAVVVSSCEICREVILRIRMAAVQAEPACEC